VHNGGVRKAGSGSWRVAIGGEHVIHAVLYVRETGALSPPADPQVPPRLVGDVADGEQALGMSGKTEPR
jgi:hypothetical protein